MKELYIVVVLIGSFFLYTSSCIADAVYYCNEGAGSEIHDYRCSDDVGYFRGNVTFTSGYRGYGLDLTDSGEGYPFVEIANSNDVNIVGGSISLMAWVNYIDSGIDQGIIVKGYGTGSVHYNLGLIDVAGTTSSRVFFRINTDAGFKTVLSSTNIGSDSGWHHVAGTYNGNYMRVYIDGVQRGTTTATSEIIGNSGSVYLGAKYDGSEYFYGYMDDIRIYEEVKTKSEIDGIMLEAEGSPVPEVTPSPCEMGEITDENKYVLLWSMSGLSCGAIVALGLVLAFRG
jgi:hypothetical protein